MAGRSVGLKTPAIGPGPEVPVSLLSGRALLSGPGGHCLPGDSEK